jgi:hypothetical protein
MGTSGSSPGLKQDEREADHLQLVPRSKDVLYTSSPTYFFTAQYLVKHKDSSTNAVTSVENTAVK